nr:MAG TPA: hypothetical protein [Caudoviricetes sp.]
MRSMRHEMRRRRQEGLFLRPVQQHRKKASGCVS